MRNWLDLYHLIPETSQLAIRAILDTNRRSQNFGLVLTNAEACDLVEAGKRALRSHGRVELGTEVIAKIIFAFCSSPHINAWDYALILNELVDLFYYMKNETEDRIGDDDLIKIMKEFFNDSSRGSIELLKNRELAIFARNFRRYNQAADYCQKEELL